MTTKPIMDYVSDRLEGISSVLKKELCDTIFQCLQKRNVDVRDSAEIEKRIGVYKHPLHADIALSTGYDYVPMPDLPLISKLALDTILLKHAIYCDPGGNESGEELARIAACKCLEIALRDHCSLKYVIKWATSRYAERIGVRSSSLTRYGTLRALCNTISADSYAVRSFVEDNSLWKLFLPRTAFEYAKYADCGPESKNKPKVQVLPYFGPVLYDMLQDIADSDALDIIEHKVREYGHNVIRYNRSVVLSDPREEHNAMDMPLIVELQH